MATKRKKSSSNNEYNNYKIPPKGWVFRIIDIEEGETSNGKFKLSIKAVHNYYDSSADDNQGSLWVYMSFYEDTAQRHADNLSEGDIVFATEYFPMEASSYEEYVNFRLSSPNLNYISWSGLKDDDEEKPAHKRTSKSKRSRREEPEDDDDNDQEEPRSRKRGSRKSRSDYFQK